MAEMGSGGRVAGTTRFCRVRKKNLFFQMIFKAVLCIKADTTNKTFVWLLFCMCWFEMILQFFFKIEVYGLWIVSNSVSEKVRILIGSCKVSFLLSLWFWIGTRIICLFSGRVGSKIFLAMLFVNQYCYNNDNPQKISKKET